MPEMQKYKIHKVKPNNRIEKCVLCGKDTPYKKETDLGGRRNYVEGCGQLCPECYKEVYL